MLMPSIEWQHRNNRLCLRIAVLAGFTSPNPTEIIPVEGLIDTGATGTGINIDIDIARRLGLRAKGRQHVDTANGTIMANERPGVRR